MNLNDIIPPSDHAHREGFTNEPLLDALGVQLKAQDLGPLEIFEGLNEQLPTADRRRLVVKLSSPVAAAIYARAGAMQSAGVPPQALAA